MSNPFSLILTVAEIGQTRAISREADEAERAEIAGRLDLIDLKSFSFEAKLASVAGGIRAVGHVKAHVVQRCAATDLAVPAKIEEPFDLRFLRDMDGDQSAEEIEVEISSEDCDIVPLENERIDIADAAVQSLSLALDPFPRHRDADRILAEKGVLREEQAGPFAALAALKDKKS